MTIRNRTLVGGYDRFVSELRAGRGQRRPEPGRAHRLQQRDRPHERVQPDRSDALGDDRAGDTPLLVGAEAGRQSTDNFRNTGFFNNTATSILVPFDRPTIATPVTFRQSATDADNHLVTTVAAAFAQDQVELSRHLQVIGGLRFDRFDVEYHNNRTGDALARVDGLVAPRAGVVFKPIAPLSLYGSYSVSYLPSSGDQFSSLTTITQQVEPEKFDNYELGSKWDSRPDWR